MTAFGAARSVRNSPCTNTRNSKLRFTLRVAYNIMGIIGYCFPSWWKREIMRCKFGSHQPLPVHTAGILKKNLNKDGLAPRFEK